jgi:hypothetical protein
MHIYTFIVKEHVARMFYMDLNEHDKLSIMSLYVILYNLSCSFTSISFLTTSCSFTLI